LRRPSAGFVRSGDLHRSSPFPATMT
jgi:hypothetical protein